MPQVDELSLGLIDPAEEEARLEAERKKRRERLAALAAAQTKQLQQPEPAAAIPPAAQVRNKPCTIC